MKKILLVLGFCHLAAAEDSAVFEAIDLIVEEAEKDVVVLSESVKKSAIVDISQNNEITSTVREYLINKLESLGTKGEQPAPEFIHCHSCFVLKAEAAGQKVHLKKGVTDRDTLLAVAKELDVDSYTRVSFVRQRFSLRLQLNVYQVSDDKVIFSKTYVKRTMSLGDRGMTFSFGIEQGMASQGDSAAGGMINLSERIHGFGDIGVTAVSFSGTGTQRNFSGVGPNFGIFLQDWEWGRLNLDLGLLYGLYGGKRNLAFKGGLRANFGTLFYMSFGILTGIKDLEEPDVGTTNSAGEQVDTSLQSVPLLSFGINIY